MRRPGVLTAARLQVLEYLEVNGPQRQGQIVRACWRNPADSARMTVVRLDELGWIRRSGADYSLAPRGKLKLDAYRARNAQTGEGEEQQSDDV